MEHRWSVRIPLIMRVTLYHNSLLVGDCRVSNIGRGGLFVKTGPLVYPRKSVLEVGMTLETDQGVKSFRLRTNVIHRTQGGLGLKFLDLNPDVSRYIQKKLLDNVDARAQPYYSDQKKLPEGKLATSD